MAIIEEFQFDNGSQTIANDVIENVQQQAEILARRAAAIQGPALSPVESQSPARPAGLAAPNGTTPSLDPRPQPI